MGLMRWNLEAAAVCQSYGAWDEFENCAACSQDFGHPIEDAERSISLHYCSNRSDAGRRGGGLFVPGDGEDGHVP